MLRRGRVLSPFDAFDLHAASVSFAEVEGADHENLLPDVLFRKDLGDDGHPVTSPAGPRRRNGAWWRLLCGPESPHDFGCLDAASLVILLLRDELSEGGWYGTRWLVSAASEGRSSQSKEDRFASPTAAPTRICSVSSVRRLWRCTACCMATAQAEASLAAPKATMRPSPRFLTSVPAWSLTLSRSRAKWAWRICSARSSPRRATAAVDPTRSVKAIATSPVEPTVSG